MLSGFIEQGALGHPYLYLFVVSFVVSSFVTVSAVRRSQKKYTTYFGVYAGSTAIWSVAEVLHILLSRGSVHYLIHGVILFVAGVMGWGWLVFTLYYTSNEPSRVAYWVSTVVMGVVTVGNLVYVYLSLGTFQFFLTSNDVTIVNTHVSGPISVQVLVLFLFVYAILGTLFLTLNTSRHTSQNRVQSLLLVLTGLVLLLGASIDTFHLHPYPNISIVSSTITAAAVLLWFGVYKYGVFDVIPVSRTEVVESLPKAVFVLDTDGKIIDVNPAGCELLNQSIDELYKTRFLEQVPRLRSELEDDLRREQTVSEFAYCCESGEEQFYNIRISPFKNSENEYAGTSVSFDNVTTEALQKEQMEEQKQALEQQKQELERQNEQLDQFASVLSHDLRNPLGVAQMYADIVQDDPSEDSFGKLTGALERMDNMIDDLLTLAREGQSVEETEHIELAAIAENAWGTVESETAELEIVSSESLEADTARLQNVFENLFRNAIEHSSSETVIQIEVGWLDSGDGFYVEDNGPGIPEDRRGEVFNHGVTYSDDGTGFGLSIVKQIVEAHGWAVTVTDAEHLDGARFEIGSVSQSTSAQGFEP